MKILNNQNKWVGTVEKLEKPGHYRYKSKDNNVIIPIYANDLAMACSKICNFLGTGYFYLLFVI